MLEKTLNTIRPLIPRRIFRFFQPAYHLTLAFLAALIYRFPSRKLKVIAVTGTKGKSSTTEILNAILEEAGHKTAVSNTIRLKIGDHSKANLFKMSMPGRFSFQHFLRQAVNADCEYAVVEMTSQGALLYRHLFTELDGLIFTNLSPEHIEAHGSYENYVRSKLLIAKALQDSPKKDKFIIVNGDDKESSRFLGYASDKKVIYTLKGVEPFRAENGSISFTWNGETITSPLSGLFNLYNILGALTAAKVLGIDDGIIASAVKKFSNIPGRVQKVTSENNKNIPNIIVDYAHTPDSLEKFYQVFTGAKNICVLGGTGGGRDTWKRAEMGKIADKYCSEIILTNEDPYDENPEQIVLDVKTGVINHQAKIIMDRGEAIKKAIEMAGVNDNVLITGKGTDPYIMGPKGSKIPWSDAEVARKVIEDR